MGYRSRNAIRAAELCVSGAVAHIFAAARAAGDNKQPDELRKADEERVQWPGSAHKRGCGNEGKEKHHQEEEQKHAEQIDPAHNVDGGTI